MPLEAVSTPEAAEVMAVNALAPFVLNSRLVPLMRVRGPATPAAAKSSGARGGRGPCPRFVVNVSAMEGKFYRHKTPHHPHTNMAKAALNMMTRTCAPQLAACDAIYMTSVDTGWVNDENPLAVAAANSAASGFQTPIDEVDAAARICDPLFAGLTAWHATGAIPAAGVFLKDYHETEW